MRKRREKRRYALQKGKKERDQRKLISFFFLEYRYSNLFLSTVLFYKSLNLCFILLKSFKVCLHFDIR